MARKLFLKIIILTKRQDNSPIRSDPIWIPIRNLIHSVYTFSNKVTVLVSNLYRLKDNHSFVTNVVFLVQVTYQRSDIICFSLVALICYVKCSLKSLCKRTESNA